MFSLNIFNNRRLRVLIFLLLAAVLVILAAGCSNEAKNKSGKNEWHLVDDGVALQTGFSKYCHYYDGTQMVFSVEKDDKTINVGPATDSKSLMKYDFDAQKVSFICPVDTNAQIYSAVPFKDGIVYTDYVERKADGGGIDTIEWQMIWQTKDSTNILQEGECTYYSKLPAFALIDGKAVVLWSDSRKGCSQFSLVTENGLEAIINEDYEWIANTELEFNGTEICFAVWEKEDDLRLVIADLNGIVKSIKLNGKMMSHTLTKDNLICGIGEYNGNDEMKMLNYDIRKGEETLTDIYTPLYRLRGGNTNYAACVLGGFSQLAVIDAKTGEHTAFEAPKGLTGKPVLFNGIYDNKMLSTVHTDKTEFYMLGM